MFGGHNNTKLRVTMVYLLSEVYEQIEYSQLLKKFIVNIM